MSRAQNRVDNVLNGSLRPFLFYLLLMLTYFLVSYISSKFIFTGHFYFQSFVGRVDDDQVKQIVAIQEKSKWLSYLILPVFLTVKIIFPAFCIYTGLVISNYEVKWNEIIRLALAGELIFLVQAISTTIYFLIYPPASAREFSEFPGLSLAMMVPHSGIPKYALYLVQTVNIFELGYWLYWSAELRSITGENFFGAFWLVTRSYGLGLLLWVTIIVFLTIQFS